MNATASRFTNLIHLVTECALDAVFPPRCAGCGIYHEELFCGDCRLVLQRIEPPFCSICGAPFDPLAQAARECARCRDNRYHVAPPFIALRAVYVFDGPPRHAIHRFKYQDKIALAPSLAAVLNGFLTEQPDDVPRIPMERVGLLIPVPLHPWRQYRRGYNQSALLARELSKLNGVPSAEVLRRTRHTTPQIELKAGERAANVKDAFAVDEAALSRFNPAGEAVLLIDDVSTTGATVAECARVLKASGIAEVYALTLAR